MARGPMPKDPSERRRRNKPAGGEWVPTDGAGWQYDAIPAPPTGLSSESADTWRTWFTSWFASHWGPEDLPGLRDLIRLYDAVALGDLTRHNELRLTMDTYGITPKGQQDRRWKPPASTAPAPESQTAETGAYAHLRAVPDEG